MFSRVPGMQDGAPGRHVLLYKWRMRETQVFLPPTVCDRPDIDWSDGVLNFKMAHHSLPPHPTPPHFRSHIILNCAHSFSRPTFFLFFLPLHYCNGLELALALILLLFKAFPSLSWAIFHYPWPSLIDSINAIWLFPPVDSEKWGEKKAVFNNPAHTMIQLIFILL